jgi:hypothetical protein
MRTIGMVGTDRWAVRFVITRRAARPAVAPYQFYDR